MMTGTSFPPSRAAQKRIRNRIKEKGAVLLIGVTGGIATGKSTVAEMLAGFGVSTIDLDLVARQVVEPGKPAWEKIVAHFGKEILRADGTLHRKKLAGIVFRDPGQRERLQDFTHPFILEEFSRQAGEMARQNPGGIIQAVVPLLIECGLQHLFDKVVVVYVPEAKQIERLVGRDGISKEEAARMLKSQLPIDEKLSLADFVIHNEGSFEETRKQVGVLWDRLTRIGR